MKKIKVINASTGTEMLVAVNRVAEYEKLGHKKVKADKKAAGKEKDPESADKNNDSEQEK